MQKKNKNMHIIVFEKTIFYIKIFLKKIVFISVFVYFCLSSITYAANLDNVSDSVKNLENLKLSLPVQTLIFLTFLTFIPALILLMSGFTRIIIVLSILRNALGTPTVPPNQILIGLSLCLTFFIMSPIIEQIYSSAYQPFLQNKITFPDAMSYAEKPIKKFMLSQTRETDLAFYSKISTIDIQDANQVPMKILLPAFVTSELKTAFQIGFTLFVPFLIIDIVVASILMALGMMMLPPTTVSLPFKLMLFVMADGWQILLGSLVKSFQLN